MTKSSIMNWNKVDLRPSIKCYTELWINLPKWIFLKFRLYGNYVLDYEDN